MILLSIQKKYFYQYQNLNTLRDEHSKKKRRYLIVVFQKIVFLRTFLYFVSKHQIQRIVQQIQRIVQQIPENCEKYKKCTRSPGKKRKIQKMYWEDGRKLLYNYWTRNTIIKYIVLWKTPKKCESMGNIMIVIYSL